MVKPAKTSRLVTLTTVIAVIAILYLARDVLIPLALAALVSFSLAPLTVRLERVIGRIAAVVTIIVLTCGLLGGITYLVAGQLTQLAEMLPEYRENIASKLSAIRGGVFEKATEAVKQLEEDVQAQRAEKEEERKAEQKEEKREEERQAGAEERQRGLEEGITPRTPVRAPVTEPLGDSGRREEKATRVQIVDPPLTSVELITGMFGPLLGPLGTGAMVMVLVLFMLLARDDLRDRIVRLMGRGQIRVTNQMMNEAGVRVSRYLLMQTLINALHGVAVAVGMYFLSIPNYLLWGLLSAVLRFVPYVGPWIAATMPILVSLAVFDNWTQPLLVAGYFGVLEVLSNNLLEPWLFGASAGVSSLAVILTSIFWAWLWGPIGLLLATPLTVCMVVLGKHVPQFHFINILFGDESAREPHARFYQRLLAMDHEAAAEVAEQFLQQGGSLVKVYDKVVLPALVLAEMDRHGDQLDERRTQFIHGAFRELIEDLGEVAARRASTPSDDDANDKGAGVEAAPLVPPPSLPADFLVLALPAHDEADELVGAMLDQLVRASGARCEVVSMPARTSDMVDVVEQRAADVVCISALPPLAVAHARDSYRRLVARFPRLPLIIGLWNASKPLEEVRKRMGSDATTPIVKTLKDALAELDQIARTRPLHDAKSAPGPTDVAAAGS